LKSPNLYTIRKFTLHQIINNNRYLTIPFNQQKMYEIKQSDNMLFRQIRLITNTNSRFMKYIIFVDCKGWRSKEKELRELLQNGFYLNGIHFIATEKSASMSRNSVIGFVDASIYEELNKRITMDINLDKTVLAKYLAYRGLFFSGCFCIENWYPNIVVVDDFSRTIPNQNIKYLVDVEKPYTNKDGELCIWNEKGIKEDICDVEINLWDGSGIHSPEITQYVKEYIGSDESPTSILWRMPYGKGMTHEVDFKRWFQEETSLSSITDVFGITHNIQDVDIIVTKSFYKGYKYFYKYGDYRDWQNYWDIFKKYDHCIGVATWNYSFDNEPRMKKSSYQILQDLYLDFEEFLDFTDYTKEWIDKIVNGDQIYTYCFLGLFADQLTPSNDYMKTVLKNPEMLKEECVRKYLIDLLQKNIDLMKCGKFYLEGSFKFVVTDLIAFLQYISGNNDPEGVLKADEFYSVDSKGVCVGERVIERNPHISHEEHVILKGVDNECLHKYCSHLSNVCQLNGHSICLPRLNGADEDGDRVFVINNETLLNGIRRNLPIVIDMEDKITVLEEEVNKENIIENIVRSMVSLVGESSNCATCYHNKSPKTDEQKQKYLNYINILSIVNGKAIDYAKTGIIFNIPRHIAKYSKPLPYFMKYAGDYYKNLNKFNKSPSNMNRMAWHIEKWHKKIKFKKKFSDFDYNIMVDDSIAFNQNKFDKLELLFQEYLTVVSELGKQNALSKNYDDYKNYYNDGLTKQEVLNTKVNWQFYYDEFADKARKICDNQKELANLVVKLCYEKYPNKNKKFIWVVASEGILENIKQVDSIFLPIKDDNGEFEYLGNYYNLQEVTFC
jgi:hypothetical protein